MPAFSQSTGGARAASVTLGGFAGLDLTSGALSASPTRSPDAPNIMPGPDGRPTRRPGYATAEQYGGPVYGAYSLTNGQSAVHLVHAGSRLYADGEVVYEGMAEAPSCAVQMPRSNAAHAGDFAGGGSGGSADSGNSSPCLWISDGQTYLCFDGERAFPASEIATAPLITIAKSPNGIGGVSYLPVNLLTGWCTDSFLGVASVKEYYLSFGNLTAARLTVEKMDAEGNFVRMETGYMVDRPLGKLTFINAPGASPVTGEDNLRVTYERQTDNAQKINKCRLSTLYGVGGNRDRVFLCGNPGEANVDRWSEFADPTYFGDVYYGVVGRAGNPIVGYAQVGDRLVTLKRDEEGGSNAVVRYGSIGAGATGLSDYALFRVENVLQGEGALGARSIGTVANEPLFLTRQGVFAMTAADITGERYMQNRSYYLNGALVRAIRSAQAAGEDLSRASCAVWGRFWALALGGRLWLLDTAQKQYEPDSPHATYQYERYVWENIGASLLFVRTDPATGQQTLCFGTEDGRVCAFVHPDEAAPRPGDYTDDGVAYDCWWTTPLLHLGSFSRRKTVTGVWVIGRGLGGVAYRGEGGAQVLDYSDADAYALTMGADGAGLEKREAFLSPSGSTDNGSTQTTCWGATRRKARQVTLFAVRVACGGEPFSLEGIEVEYRMGGRVR